MKQGLFVQKVAKSTILKKCNMKNNINKYLNNDRYLKKKIGNLKDNKIEQKKGPLQWSFQ